MRMTDEEIKQAKAKLAKLASEKANLDTARPKLLPEIRTLQAKLTERGAAITKLTKRTNEISDRIFAEFSKCALLLLPHRCSGGGGGSEELLPLPLGGAPAFAPARISSRSVRTIVAARAMDGRRESSPRVVYLLCSLGFPSGGSQGPWAWHRPAVLGMPAAALRNAAPLSLSCSLILPHSHAPSNRCCTGRWAWRPSASTRRPTWRRRSRRRSAACSSAARCAK
jgi:hypothetical protein